MIFGQLTHISEQRGAKNRIGQGVFFDQLDRLFGADCLPFCWYRSMLEHGPLPNDRTSDQQVGPVTKVRGTDATEAIAKFQYAPAVSHGQSPGWWSGSYAQ